MFNSFSGILSTHFKDYIAQCYNVVFMIHVWVLVSQSSLTFFDPMDCSPPDSSVHGVFQARMLEWVAIPFSRASSWSRDWTQISCIAGGLFTVWATREAHYDILLHVKKKKKKRQITKLMFNLTLSKNNRLVILILIWIKR